MSRLSFYTAATAASTLLLALAAPQAQAQVFWVDWQNATGTAEASIVTGQLLIGGDTVNVTYTGETAFVQTDGGTNYWEPDEPYISATVPNAPPAADIIALQAQTTKTITFSQAITNPLFAVVSLNGNGYQFDRDFTILSTGSGFFGSGTLTKEDAGGGIFRLIGSGEPHGVIQFQGTFTSVTWNSLSNEFWNGFTIGVTGVAPPPPSGVAPEPASALLLAPALPVIVALRRRRRK